MVFIPVIGGDEARDAQIPVVILAGLDHAADEVGRVSPDAAKSGLEMGDAGLQSSKDTGQPPTMSCMKMGCMFGLARDRVPNSALIYLFISVK
ncbi:MAG: hypothetical protein ABSF52_06970 [Syntrophobacteraceae bacterium]